MCDLLKKILLICLIFLTTCWGWAQSHRQSPYLFKSGLRNPVSEVRQSFHSGVRFNINRAGYWDSLYTLAQQNGLSLFQCKILYRIGACYQLRNEPKKGIEACKKGIEIAERHGYKAEAIALIQVLEKLHTLQYNRHEALRLAYKGLKMAEELGDKRSVIDFHSSIGMFYYKGGEFEKAFPHHLRCLQMSRAIGYDFGVCSALADLGSNYLARGQPQKAFPYLIEQLKYLPMLDKTVYAVEVLTSVSAVYMGCGRYDSANYYMNLAYARAIETGDKRAISSTLTAFATLCLRTGHIKKAEKLFLTALTLAKQTRFIEQQANVYAGLRILHHQAGNYRKAFDYFRFETLLSDCLSNENIHRIGMENEFAYQMQKKENFNSLLQKEILIGSLRLQQNRYLAAGLGIALVLLLLIVLLLRRQSNLRNKYTQLQMERKLLLAQMNPHFIFNSMNSVRQLIMDKENDTAEFYLSKLAKLTRRLLKSSTQESITISEEVELLNAYLEMESLRFGNSFSYSVHVDQFVNASLTSIPHLMIQPLVENAIWHGLLPKEENRLLQIKIEYDSTATIRCIVDDNGIGRDASRKNHGYAKEESLAFSFISQRIRLLKKTLHISGAMKIIDKKDVSGNSLGTTAVIILPVLKPSI